MQSNITTRCAGLSTEERAFFEREGYVGPFSLIDQSCVELITQQLRKEFFPNRWRRMIRSAFQFTRQHSYQRWIKGAHAESAKVCNIATNSAILDRVESAIGSDILLWASALIDKKPGDHHGWHADVEHVEWTGITAWIGLSGVTPLSSLSVITRSHKIDNYPQKLKLEICLDQHSDDDVLKAAQAVDPDCQLLHLNIKPGEFVLFAGKTWHEARHLTTGVRSSLIFQYSPPSEKIRIPLSYTPPIAWHNSPPPCCLVRGKDTVGINLVVPCPI
jgi:ectoine hydroxylase-related dioxygenase (phytanoyl-CoA dioxygenase family)